MALTAWLLWIEYYIYGEVALLARQLTKINAESTLPLPRPAMLNLCCPGNEYQRHFYGS